MKKLLLLSVVLYFCVGIAFGDGLDEVKKKYPSDSFLVGIGIVQSSGNQYKDKRRSEILARLEIAKMIKVMIKESTVDVICEQRGKAVFNNKTECVNQFNMLVEESVDQVLEGSKIVESGQIQATFYSVAVLPKNQAAGKADAASKEAKEEAKQHIDNAKKTGDTSVKKDETEKAKDALKKSLAYDGEKLAMEKTKQNSDDVFKELAADLETLQVPK